MKSFILHVYPRDITPESPPGHHEIVGVVESVEDEKQTPFTSPQELWKILAEAENQPGVGKEYCPQMNADKYRPKA